MLRLDKKKWVVLTLILGSLQLYSQNHKPKKQDRPNILWLTCEDISPMLSFYGDSTAHTPNLDKLAKESLIFTKAYAVVGVCGPSRSSIITGMYPASIGTQNMRTGKDAIGWGTRKYDQVSKAIDLEGSPVRQYAAVIPEFVKCFTEYLRADGYYCTNNVKTDYQFAAPVTAWDQNSKEATWQNCPPGKPFFSIFNFEETHESKIWLHKGLPQTVSAQTVPLPEYFPENPVVRQDVARAYSNIELLDSLIGIKIEDLKKAGLYDNTIIFFYSDHGGPLPRGKREIYESGLRVPLLVHFPKGEIKGKVDDPVSFVDLAPTILSLAGIKPPDYMQGQAFLGKFKSSIPRKYIFGSGDRFDEFSDRIRIVRDKRYLFVKNFYPDLPAYKDVAYRKQMDIMNELLQLRNQGKLSGPTLYWFRQTKAREEFYDCETDPYNLTNLIDDPKYKGKISELRTTLEQHIITIKDKADIAESKMIEQMWPGAKQPQTAKPIISIKDGVIQISCLTPGASIGYILSDKQMTPNIESGWQLYHLPIKAKKAKFIYTIANRIGYSDSEIVSKELNKDSKQMH